MAQDTCGVPLCRDAQDRLCVADLMLREANHRIANSLQAVMAAAAADTGPNGIVSAGARDQMMMRISAITLVHRMLSVSATFDTIAIGDYLTNLCESIGVLWSKPGGARITVHHGDGKVAADIAVRLGMVVNELVTNSFKYAYGKGTGEIRVAFSIMDGSFVLIVADDGRGIDASSVSRRGTGLRLVESIAKQLNASFSYQPARPGTIAVLNGPAEVLLGPVKAKAPVVRGRSHAPLAQQARSP